MRTPIAAVACAVLLLTVGADAQRRTTKKPPPPVRTEARARQGAVP